MKQNMGIRRRLASLLENDKRRWFLLNALFLSLPGIPIVYYGDEIGMGDNIWLPDRHGCRTPMQWDASKNAGFSTAEKTYYPVISEGEFDYRNVNVAAQESDPDSYLNLMRFLLHTRQSQPALRDGDFMFVGTGADNASATATSTSSARSVLAFRRFINQEGVLCLFNLSEEPQSFTLNRERVDLLSRENKKLVGEIELSPFSAYWLG